MEDRQLADHPSRRALRAGDAVRHAGAGLLAQEQLGAAPRRRLGSEPAAARARCSRTTAATMRACRAISPPARSHRTRSITADYFDANLTQPVPDGTVDDQCHDRRRDDDALHAAGRAADDIDPNAKLSYYNEWVAGSEYTPRTRARCRRPLRAPRYRTGARRRAAVPDRGHLARPAGRRHRELPADQPGSGHAGRSRTFRAAPSASSRRSTTTTRSSSRRTSGLRTSWSLISSYRWSRLTGNFEGLLPQRQRPVRSRHHVAVRLSDQRSDVHVDRRGRCSAIRATSASSAPPGTDRCRSIGRTT